MRKRTIRIEKRPAGKRGSGPLYSVVKYREDGEGTSVGLTTSKTEAKRIKKANLWSKKKKKGKR